MRATWNNGLFEAAALVALANDAWAICVSSVGELWGSFGARREEELARACGCEDRLLGWPSVRHEARNAKRSLTTLFRSSRGKAESANWDYSHSLELR